MKTILAIAITALCASCADTGFYRTDLPVSQRILTAPDWWAKDLNPLDQPGHDGELPTVEELHRGNIRAITTNSGYDLWDELHENWKP